MIQVMVWLSGLASLAGFLLFLPVFMVFSLIKRNKASTAVAYAFCMAVVLFYCLLLNNVEKAVKEGNILHLKAIRYLAPATWLLMRDELWNAVAESEQAFPSVWKFMLDHGASPDVAFKKMFLYRTGAFTDEQNATLAEMLLTVQRWRGPPAELTQILEHAFENRHYQTIIAFARLEISCYSLKFQPGGKSLLHLAADAGADAYTLSRLAACMGYAPWREFDASGYTPVHYLRYPEQLEALPSASEAVLLFTRDGATLLHLAVQNGYHELFEQILQSGFASETPDLDGCPPAFYATDFATFQKLRPKGLNHALADTAAFNRLWGNALKSGSEDFVETLLQEGADPDAKLLNGQRPLHQIIQTQGVDLNYIPRMIARLASAGADINQPNWNAETPLHFAVMENKIAAARLLIDLGANARLRNMQGKTVLSLMWETPNKALWSDLYHQVLMQGILAEVEHPVDQNLPDWNRSFPADYSVKD